MNENLHPKISIIIPVYNSEKYIKRCIESIIDQNYNNLEIIIIDDGSIDTSYKICKYYQESDKRIILHKQDNAGVSSARNIGLRLASGEYITFIDSDDYVDKNFFNNYYKFISFGKNIYISGYKKIKNKKCFYTYSPKYKKISIKNAIIELLEDNTFCNYLWNKLYHKDIIKNFIFKEGKVFEDIDAQYKLFLNCDNIITCSFCGYNYNMQNQSITNKKIIKTEIDHMDIQLDRFYNIKYMSDKVSYLLCRSLFSSYINFISVYNSSADINYIDEYQKINNSIFKIDNDLKMHLSFVKYFILKIARRNTLFSKYFVYIFKNINIIRHNILSLYNALYKF